MPFLWDRPPRVIGHRGSPREAPENTLASFEAARADGVAAIELDARLSADGEVVVHHDAELGRILPGAEPLESLPGAELRRRGAPFLREVLAMPDLLVDLELKADAQNAADLPRAAWEAVRRAGAEDRVLATSFDPALADAYARLSGRPAGAISPYAPEPDELASWPRLRFLALSEDAAVDEAIALANEAGRVVLVWTVNDEASASRLLAEGAAGIITDRPGALQRALR